jgi:hypothetical protein
MKTMNKMMSTAMKKARKTCRSTTNHERIMETRDEADAQQPADV